jgi:hypothetical protein
MHKLALAGLGVVVALTVPTIALAQTQQNTYSVSASVTPKNQGSTSKPVPVAVKFGYKVGEATGLKPAAVKRYTIGFGGLRTNGKAFKTCQASQMSGTDSGCSSKALVGTGSLTAFVYADSDPSGANGGFVCQKTLHVWNAGANKAVLFLNGDPNQCGGVGALPPIPAKYVKFGSNGTALQFDVPPTVLHPIGGLTVAVTNVSSTIKKQTATVKGKKVGYFESIAKKHPVQVTFVTEAGQTGTAKANG